MKEVKKESKDYRILGMIFFYIAADRIKIAYRKKSHRCPNWPFPEDVLLHYQSMRFPSLYI